MKWTSVKDGKTGNNKDCWTWYRDGKRYLTFWSGEKNKKEGYYDWEIKSFKRGDKVSAAVRKLKAKKK